MGWGRLAVPALFVKLLGTTLTVSLNVMRSIVLTNFLCSGTSIIVKPFFSKLMFTTYNQVKPVCGLFISCTKLVFVNSVEE